MSYTIDPIDPSLTKAVRRIAAEQLAKAQESLEYAEGPVETAEAIHDARKRCKKLRGLIRLVRPGFKTYAEENAALRDAARQVSELRDKAALIEALDRVTAGHSYLDRRRTLPLRKRLVEARDAAQSDPEVQENLARFRSTLMEVGVRAGGWKVRPDKWKSLRKGLAKTYARGRAAMEAAQADPTAEALHEWRKRVKYHWYHTRLLTPIWRGPMRARAREAHRLSDLLGERQDLHVLSKALDGMMAEPGRSELAAAIEADRGHLEAQAFDLGARLYADDAKALTARWGTWWKRMDAA